MKRTKGRYEITDEARFELKEDENVKSTVYLLQGGARK